LGKIVRFKRDLHRRLRRWPAFGAMLFLGLLIAIGIGAYSQFATPESGSASLPRILRPKVSAQPIVGRASVVDGDTIEIHGTRIRLFGIDAPEGGQTCTVQGKAMPCGQRAAFALADKIGKQVVECRPKDEDRYGRVVAVCGVGGEDINAWMVAQGWALAYRYYSRDYVSQERSASKTRLGKPPDQRSGQPARFVEPPAVMVEKILPERTRTARSKATSARVAASIICPA
jgi:endonuclease YncB( thermonuclease family)